MSTTQSPLIEEHTCLSEDIVLAFQRGETSEGERQLIHRHIDACDDCRTLLLATAAMDADEGALGVELDSMERLAAVIGSGFRMMTFAEGKRLAHRFDVTRFVDRGGMGEVYEAFDNVVGARVALKALLCTTTEDEPGTGRLGDEVKLARRIAHPNVCRIYDMHEHREAEHRPLRFLAMEFVDGVTLKERLLAGEMAIDEACSIARQLLLGLCAVHSAGVLHLDFKSQNVMLRHGKSPAEPVVMDFSLSRAFDKELRLRTSERRAAGSIGYMSPEQLECRSTIGPAADVYAFGVVFYEMLTGHMPFQGDSPAAVILKQLKSRAVPPSRSRPAVPPALDEFVLACLSRHARSRFQSVASAIEAFDRSLEAASSKRRASGGPWPRTAAIAMVAALGAGTLVHVGGRMAAAEAATGATRSAGEPLLQPLRASATPHAGAAASHTPAPVHAAAPAAASAVAPSAASASASASAAPALSAPGEPGRSVPSRAPALGSVSRTGPAHAGAGAPAAPAGPERREQIAPARAISLQPASRRASAEHALPVRAAPAQPASRQPSGEAVLPPRAASVEPVPAGPSSERRPAPQPSPPASEDKPDRGEWVPKNAPEFLL